MSYHYSIDTALQKIRQDIAKVLSPEAIVEACHQAGHHWRNRTLTPSVVIHWFIQQVLLQNTSAQHVSLLSNREFTDSAYCQARSGLPLAVFHTLLRNLTSAVQSQTRADGLWRGHRTFLVDGSAISMPDTKELQLQFGQPGGQTKGCGFPVAKILAMFHSATGLLMEIAIAPLRTHEMSQISQMHPSLKAGDVLVGDRGFCSFAHLAMLIGQGVHAVFRVHQRQKVDFKPGRKYAMPNQKGKEAEGLPRSRQVRKLAPLDQVVEWFLPGSLPEWLSPQKQADLPASLMLRELQYSLVAKGFRTRQITLVTTLLDAEAYPAESLTELYGVRWRVEQQLRDLKQTLRMDILKCKKVDGVMKEIYIFAIVYNLVRLVMYEAAKKQGKEPDRISFIDALRWLNRVVELETEIPRLVANPLRVGRFEPRVRKRRPKQFPLMKKPRSELKEDQIKQRLAA